MPVKRVSAAEAHELMEQGYAYVDVRSVPEFESGHPAGAYNIPLLHMGPGGLVPNPDFVKVMKSCFGTDARLVLGCRSGARSYRAAEQLMSQGFSEVLDQKGGYSGSKDPFGQTIDAGWQPAGLPTSTEAEDGRSWEEISRAQGAGSGPDPS